MNTADMNKVCALLNMDPSFGITWKPDADAIGGGVEGSLRGRAYLRASRHGRRLALDCWDGRTWALVRRAPGPLGRGWHAKFADEVRGLARGMRVLEITKMHGGCPVCHRGTGNALAVLPCIPDKCPVPEPI